MIMKNKYEVVIDYINQRIDSGFYKAHQMIDSENELAEALNISRVTVRRAIDELVSDRVLYRQHGRGTFVRSIPSYKEFRNGVGFTREVLRRDEIPSSKDVELRRIFANEDIAQQLQIIVGEPVWEVKRTRCANNVPIVFEHVYFPEKLVGILVEDDLSGSLYALLEARGIQFDYADQSLQAILADAQLSKQLNISVGDPLIKMEVIAYMENGTPFNSGSSYYQTSSFKLYQTVFNS
ncbi:GntR family transcriptional regulator [Erysipelothrix aquatica]|uniref:GntR family transcriptional regulator n=1 Tax=Erysipelothrix aquatica TaxID=2683714 RepID=UPI0013597E42|nr:GntR family transcriptional regulator [Erysipelothrix aquatica]